MLREHDETPGRAELSVVQPSRSSSDGRFSRAAELPELEPFAVEVRRRDHVTIVQPRGELDLATVETLSASLDAAIVELLLGTLDGFETAARLVLDLRGLSFIDSTGLHLLVALDEQAQRDGFVLTLVAPAAPADRAIDVSGLYPLLPFVKPDDAVGSGPARAASGS